MMFSAKHDRKYPCAAAQLSWHSSQEGDEGEKADDALCCKEPQEQAGGGKSSSTCKSQIQIQTDVQEGRQMEPHSSCPNTLHLASQGKIYSWVHPALTSSFISALSPKEQALLGMLFWNESQAYSWAPSYNLAPHSAVQGSSFCWLLYKGMTSPQHPGLHWEKFFLHLLCGCCRVCRHKDTGAGQK